MTEGTPGPPDWSARQVAAARRVLVDLGQVLGTFFEDSLVVVGGWVPDLLLAEAEERHVGSIDVDLALDATRLRQGRYARILQALLETGRYERADEPFRLRARVDLRDGGMAVVVDVDFLKAPGRLPAGRGPDRVPGFRPIDAAGCTAAFNAPRTVTITGHMISGDENRVTLRVAAIEDFLLMKAFALAGRDKSKDAYDICYCLEQSPEGIDALARAWRERRDDPLIPRAVTILRDKFATVGSYGPRQVAAFRDARAEEDRDRLARQAFELVQRFIRRVDEP